MSLTSGKVNTHFNVKRVNTLCNILGQLRKQDCFLKEKYYKMHEQNTHVQKIVTERQ